MTNFKKLLDVAIERKAKDLYKPEYNRSSWDENAKPRGLSEVEI